MGKLRPLCIDFRSRAQEIYITERDEHVRRAASCMLSHRMASSSSSSALERRRHQDESRGEVNGYDEEAENNQHDDPVDRFETRVVNSVDINSTSTNEQQRIQSILSLLGPAVHPSECALRSISPVTKGPIRNKILPIDNIEGRGCVLVDLVERNEEIMGRKFNDVLASLESGRSRFVGRGGRYSDSGGRELKGVGGGVEDAFGMESMHDDASNDDTFVQTMKVLYSRDGDVCSTNDESPPNSTTTTFNNGVTIDTHHTKYPKTSYPIQFRHEPTDLAKIHQDKSMKSSNATSYSKTIVSSFRPKLAALSDNDGEKEAHRTANGFVLVGTSAGRGESREGMMSTFRPTFAPKKFYVGKKSLGVDYSSRGISVPFTKFLDVEYSGEGGRQVRVCLSLWCFVLVLFAINLSHHPMPFQPSDWRR